ncbi:unnamed protein product [Rotaria sp. Silwood1]|nr:unnamed protein product [Rotaria sp. Silwood1]CAF3492082.1 unnamed protein product [Rotaria sp. Silwood1]CAF5043246.1 unnamed protein product [Rotaria sp. Silwood1]
MNQSRVPVYLTHVSAGTSVKYMIHYAQGVRINKFQANDYCSPEENHLYYNQTTPPLYSIRSTKILTVIFWAGNTWVADPVHVSYIFDNIQSSVYQKYIPDYNHLDVV